MKKILCLMTIFLCRMLYAQTTQVTATISGYGGGSVIADFVGQGGTAPQPSMKQHATGAINSSGVFTLTLASNSSYAPSQWTFLITAGQGQNQVGYRAQQFITGTTQDISSIFTAAPQPPGGTVDATARAEAAAAQATANAALPLAGGTLTGPLNLSANPTTNLQAATKQYVDSSAGGGASFPSSTTGVICNTSTTASVNCSGGQIAAAIGTTAITNATNATSVGGITVSGTPSTGQVPTATSATAATWQTPTPSSSGISGLTTGQVPIAGSATTVTSSKPLAGAGDGITTGPTSAASGDLAFFNGSTGQISDGGIAGANVVTLAGTQTLTNKTIDGVTPTTMGFVDPTSSIQNQLNSTAKTSASNPVQALGPNTVFNGDSSSFPTQGQPMVTSTNSGITSGIPIGYGCYLANIPVTTSTVIADATCVAPTGVIMWYMSTTAATPGTVAFVQKLSLNASGNVAASGTVSGSNLHSGEFTQTSTTTALTSTPAMNTITLAGNYTFTLAAGAAGQQMCLQFVQNATTAFTVTSPANVVGFFSSNTGAIGTTLGKRNTQCYIYSSTGPAWVAINGGVINQ